MNKNIKYLLIFIAILGIANYLLSPFLNPEKNENQSKIYGTKRNLSYFDKRPLNKKYVFDEAGILTEIEEYYENYINKTLITKYDLEVVVVTLSDLQGQNNIDEAAFFLLNNWGIGNNHNGRGIVLFFVEKSKAVKIEVGLSIENIFTKRFVEYLQDYQLKPGYLSGDVKNSLAVAFKEIEKRAKITKNKNFDISKIKKLDEALFKKDAEKKDVNEKIISEDQKAKIEILKKYPAGKTPDEAWNNLVQAWKDKIREPELGIYTEMGKLIFRDIEDQADESFDEKVAKYADKPYKVLQKGDYAVIYFDYKKGWNAPPFFFCKTKEGWKFDVVHQRKLVKMGPRNTWGVEKYICPYCHILRKFPRFFGIDIPLEEKDIYKISEDNKFSDRIKELEKLYKSGSMEFEEAIELTRLYTITAIDVKAIPILEELKKQLPENPDAYKYMAIAQLYSTYEYDKSIEEINEYINLLPEDEYGYSFLGYLYLQKGEYGNAMFEFEKALMINPKSCYANAKLARIYKRAYEKLSDNNEDKEKYKDKYKNALNKAEKLCTDKNYERFVWLMQWEHKK